MDCLCKIGLPQELLRAISCLYSNNEHILKLKGQRFPSFTATGGVRQGCPLSPLLFVICVDVLLRKLQHFFPDSCIRAYADDNAMVTPNFTRDGGKILALYKAFGEVSNLRLNLPKTVLIPLWPCCLEQMKATWLQERFPEWCQTELNTWSLYLGFAVGPGRSTHSWDKALVKYKARANLWKDHRLGLHYAAHCYNSLVLPTLSFIWQLEDVPEQAFHEETAVLCSLTRGPSQWRLPSDLYHLHAHFGQTRSFNSLRHVALAAKLRVLILGDLQVEQRAGALRTAQSATNFLERFVQWNSWYNSSYLFVLQRSDAAAKSMGINADVVYSELKTKDTTTAKHLLQRTLASMLLKVRSFNVDCDERLRHKLKR